MAKKGTGWIPDFPDIKDYTLKGNKIDSLTDQLQKDRSTESHEKITSQLAQALRVLKSQSASLSVASENRRLTRELNNLISNLDKSSTGGIFFADIRIHKTLSQGMTDPEVLRVKTILNFLYDDFLDPHQFDIFNPTFDDLIKDLVQDFQSNRGLPVDGQVGRVTMDALRWAEMVKRSFQKYGLYSYHYYCPYEDIEQINAVVKALENHQKKLKQDTYSLTESDKIKLLREAIADIRYSRNLVKETLTNNNVTLSPLAKKWLDDAREKRTATELEQLIESSPNRQSDTGFFDLHSSLHRTLVSINHLIERIANIPGTLSVPAPFSTDDSNIEKLDSLIPSQVFDSVFRNLFSGEAAAQLLQLMQPLTWSEFNIVSSDTDLNYYDTSSYVFKQRERTARRLNHQLDILGFPTSNQCSSVEENQEETWNKANARLDEFEQANAYLTVMIDELFQEKTGMHQDDINNHEAKTIYDEYRHSVLFEQIAIEVQDKVYSFVLPIARAVLQIISPLGRHGNLERAIREGLETFASLLRQPREIDDLSQIITTGNENSRLAKPNEIDNYAHLKRVSLAAIQSISYKLAAESQSLLSGLMTQAIAQYITQAELFELEVEAIRHAGGTSEAKPLLELVEMKNGHYESADLKIPIDWDAYQALIQRHEPKKQQSEKTTPEPATIDNFENFEGANPEAETTENLNEGQVKRIHLELPDFVDLSFWCSPVADQGSIDACTAHAGVALVEYFAKKAFGKYTEASRLFLYKTARNLMHRQGDSGTSVRETMKAMVLFGIPPEEHWPYDETKYDEEPTTFCYSFAGNYKALKYFRLDYAGISLDALLIQIKAVLAAGFPCMFGFTIYTSIHEESNVEQGHIPHPSRVDTLEGGHAAVAIGYDDSRMIENADGKRSKGAILVRNSWGSAWGQGGYGWLPYDYVLSGLTADWWSLFQTQWVESGQFGVGASHWLTHMGGNRGRL
ncbi:MAG: hypothetical protein EA342_12135 [Leptolyngbya sp. LCM1.Bin17]|nr:MAG: hypothetical protein EA342_12135 [Leptolyngbya sp. LCM1.Bin17]